MSVTTVATKTKVSVFDLADAILTTVVYDGAYFLFSRRLTSQASCERPTENVCTHNDVMEMCVSAA